MGDQEIEAMRCHVQDILHTGGSHGMDHVLRVVRLCELIGRAEGADMRTLIPAALFHDIARPKEEKTGMPHERAGAEMAERYLTSVRYDGERIRDIAHAIRTHRYRSAERPETLEARILSDADKLDALGAVGIARTFIRAGEHGGGIGDAAEHIHDKLLHLNGLMYTGTARTMAEERHRFLCSFLETLAGELDPRVPR